MKRENRRIARPIDTPLWVRWGTDLTALLDLRDSIRRGGCAVTIASLSLVACGGTAPPASPVVSPALPSAAPSGLGAPETVPVPAASAPIDILPPEAQRVETVSQLAHFYAALRGLEKKSRKSHVRVYWMGDSHAQADFWSGALRNALQDKFGNGGPGFLHLGYKNYRHDGARLQIEGKWRMRPKKPAGVKTEGDGVVGLGGLLMGGYADTPRADVTLSDALPGKTVTYDFCYRLREAGDAIDVTVAGKRVTLSSTKAEPFGEIRHATFTGEQPAELAARPIGKSPDFCGVAIETDPNESPGVVLDTLGINGARYATALSWNEKSWQSEAARRPPDLVVLEYGTNEAGDPSPAYTATAKNVGDMVARIRAVKSDVDCVVVSATDRVDVEDHLPPMNSGLKKAADAAGCFYFDAYTLLGGQGAAAKMRDESPPLVQKDGIHLTIRGYRQLGGKMFEAIMKGY